MPGLTAVPGTGAPTPKRRGGSGPPPTHKLPDPPGWLSDDAKAYWDKLAPAVPEGLLDPGNADLFAMLCTSLATYAEADQAVAAGVLIAAGQDLVPNPALAVRNTADAMAWRWAREFGLLPSGRQAKPSGRTGPRTYREA